VTAEQWTPASAAAARVKRARRFHRDFRRGTTFIESSGAAHMNKSELAQALAARTDLSRADATRAVEAIFNPEDGLITEALRQGDRVQITGFGTFETRERKARTGRNPRTGHEIRIGPTTSASFRPGKALKDAVKPADQ
jgi:DNA-binding protein HU-beta